MDRLVVGLVTAVLALVTPAPVAAESVTVDPGDTVAGASVTVTFSGFSCGTAEMALDLLTPGERSLGEHASGERVPIPGDVSPGTHELDVGCPDGVDAGFTTIRIRPEPVPAIAVSPLRVEPGAAVTISGSGFDDCVTTTTTHDGYRPVEVSVTVDGAEVARAEVGEQGAARGRFGAGVAAPAAAGDHPVNATCANRDLGGSTTASTIMTVAAAAIATSTVTRTPTIPRATPTAVPIPMTSPVRTDAVGPTGATGSGGTGIGGGIVVALLVLLAVGGRAVMLRRRRTRPAIAGAGGVRPRAADPERLPDVAARPAGTRSGPVVVSRVGPTPDVAVRVVARASGRS